MIKIFEAVLAQIHTVQQDLSFCGIVEPGDQFHHGCLALAVLPDQRHSLSRLETEIHPVENESRTTGIPERDVTKLESAQDRPWSRQPIRLGPNGRLHFKECKQVSEEECLVRDAGEGRENLLDIAAGLKNGPRKKGQCADAEGARDCSPNHEHVSRVIAHRADD